MNYLAALLLMVTMFGFHDLFGQKVANEETNTKLSTDMLTALAKAEKTGSKSVAEVFKSPKFRAIYSRLYEEHKSKIISGKYFIKKNFENKHVVNYIFGATAPLSFKNMEFALQFNKAE